MSSQVNTSNSVSKTFSEKYIIHLLVLAAFLYLGFFLFWFVLAGMLFLSYKPTEAGFAYLTLLAYPLVSIGSLSAAFVRGRRNEQKKAFRILFYPLINIILIFVSFVPIWP